jgi:hypothetical protein
MISEQRCAGRLDGEFPSAPKIKAWWAWLFPRRHLSTKLALMDRSIITPSRSGTYVVATLRQLLDGDVAPKTHCNEKAPAAESDQVRPPSVGQPSHSCYHFVMTWIRNGSFPLIPRDLEITLSDEDWRNWITIKGEDSQTAERAAEAVLRALNLTPDLIADVKPDRSIDDERGPDKERSNERPWHGFD